MEKVEVIELFAAISNLYPNSRSYANADDIMITTWTTMLKDLQKMDVSIALKVHASKSPLPPSISDIRKIVAELHAEDNPMSGMDAWNLVIRAVRRSAYRSNEEFNKLPDVCKRLVGSPTQLREWAMVDDPTVLSVAKSQFLKAFEQQKTRESELQLLPSNIRKLLTSNQNLLTEGV